MSALFKEEYLMCEVAFVINGVYLMKSCRDIAFICQPCYNDSIGKLIQYKRDGQIFEKTGISYFLNCYFEGDIKSIFLNPENYDFLGVIGDCYKLADEGRYLMRCENEG